MPLIVEIEVDPSFKAENKAERDTLEAAKKRGRVTCDHATALDNIRLSGGMYRLREAPVAPLAVPALEDMPSSQLLTMAVTFGYQAKGEVARGDLLAFVREKVDAITVTEE